VCTVHIGGGLRELMSYCTPAFFGDCACIELQVNTTTYVFFFELLLYVLETEYIKGRWSVENVLP